MRADKKALRALQKLADLTGESLESLQKLAAPTDTPETKSNHAEAVLAYAEAKGKGWETKICKSCNEAFAALPYPKVAYCTNTCRAKSLADIGILWRPNRTESERWDRVIPLVVPAPALAILEDLFPQYEQLELFLGLESAKVPA